MKQENIYRMDLGAPANPVAGLMATVATDSDKTIATTQNLNAAPTSETMEQPLVSHSPVPLVPAYLDAKQVENQSFQIKRPSLSMLWIFLVTLGAAVFIYFGKDLIPWQSWLGKNFLNDDSQDLLQQQIAAQDALARKNAARMRKKMQNPYWDLPNPTKAANDNGLTRQWSAEEEAIWNAGLAHKFQYQRFKTVQEIRRYQLSGSEKLLLQALDQPKLWTRMQAVIALAELGKPVDLSLVEKALGKNERSSLVKNYFKRFTAGQSIGERHILRHAIKIADAPTRREIIRALVRSPDEWTNLYLVAATFDPESEISNNASEFLVQRKIRTEDREALAAFVKGRGELPEKLFVVEDNTPEGESLSAMDSASAAASSAGRNNGNSSNIKVEYFGDAQPATESEKESE